MKKFFRILLSATFLVSASVPVFASNLPEPPVVIVETEISAPQNVRMTTNHGYIPSEYDTPEEIAADRRKFEQAKQREKEQPEGRAATWNVLPGSYRLFRQETASQCASACVQSVLYYLKGSTPTQASIASAIGIEGAHMQSTLNYINNNQSRNTYLRVRKSSIDQNGMNDRLYKSITDFQTPPLVGLQFTEGLAWPYSTDGHMMTCYAAMSDKTSFMVADPWIGFAGLNYPEAYARGTRLLWNALVDLGW